MDGSAACTVGVSPDEPVAEPFGEASAVVVDAFESERGGLCGAGAVSGDGGDAGVPSLGGESPLVVVVG